MTPRAATALVMLMLATMLNSVSIVVLAVTR